MYNYFTKFGASTEFERNRLVATTKTLQAPQQNVLKKILKTFEGEDQETRSQIAFATIIKKILTSDSNDNWIYLVKNLIILDRVLEDMCFIQEISELSLPIIEGYVQRNSHYAPVKTDQIVRSYWKLIKETSKIMRTKKSIIFYPRSQRSQFLQTLNTKQVLRQIQYLQSCFKNCFNLINSIQSSEGMDHATEKAKRSLQKSKLMGYIKLQLLYKLTSYYSSQMLCTNRIVSLLAKDSNMDLVQLQSIKNFKQTLIKFKNTSNLIIQFVERNKDIKGFQVINYRDFDPMPGNNLLKSIDRCITQRVNSQENTQTVQQYISDTPLKIQLRPKNAQIDNIEITAQPRKKIQSQRPKKSQTSNPFSNWKSSYCQDFPQKEIMTVDLIMALKKQKQQADRMSNYDDVITYNDRQTCVIENNEQLPDHLHFKKPNSIELNHKFSNLYSGLQIVWNVD